MRCVVEPLPPTRCENAVIHSAATLRYFLLEGHVRLEPLRVFDSRQVQWSDRVVTFFVLGTSHAMRVERGDTTLTELLTCAKSDLEARVLEHRDASPDWSFACEVHGLEYECGLSSFELLGSGQLRGEFRPTDQLTVTYGAGQDAPAPMTSVAWRMDDATLSVETLHTYPQEGRGVRSHSTFRTLPGREPDSSLTYE